MNLEEKRFYIYPQALFDDQDFSRLDLIVYGRIKCLKNGLTTSYEKAAEMFEVTEIAIKRAVPKLLQKGWLLRKKGAIITLDHPFIDSIKNDTLTPESEPKVSKTIPQEYQGRYSDSIKNDTLNSINNNIINKEREGTLSHSLSLLDLREESAIGSGRLKIANSEFLALTFPEAEMVEKLLIQAKFSNPSQVQLVLLTASAIAEGSESRKASNKSFLYIKSAIDDLLKTRKLKQDLENSESRTTNSNQLKNNNGYSNLEKLPNRKLVRATIKEQPSLDTIALVKDLTAKLCG